MPRHLVPVNLRLVYRPNSTPNELLWYRFIVGELNKISKVVYARPHLPNTNSLSKDSRRIDLVLNGPRERLTQIISSLRGLQMRENATIGSSTVLLDQVIKNDYSQELENIYNCLEQQRDISRRQNVHGLKEGKPVVRVEPWIFGSSAKEIPSSGGEETLKRKIDEFYAAVSKFHDSDHFVALEATLYPDLESMPSGLRKWFIGAGGHDKFRQKRQDVLDILTHGFKGFV